MMDSTLGILYIQGRHVWGTLLFLVSDCPSYLWFVGVCVCVRASWPGSIILRLGEGV